MVFQLYLFPLAMLLLKDPFFLNKWSLWEVALEKELAEK